MKHLHIDIETYCDLDLKKVGAHKYAAHDSFRILVVAWSYGLNTPIECCEWEKLPEHVRADLTDTDVMKVAHNAAFERTCLAAVGIPTPPDQWRCSMVKALYCGLPGKLEDLSKVLGLKSGKLSTGTALINYFCKPCKPTKTNGGRLRNLPEHNPVKWQELKTYCTGDVAAEMEIVTMLAPIKMPLEEWRVWQLDQHINDRGVAVDEQLVRNAIAISEHHAQRLAERAKEITGLSNPNSLPQLKKWLTRNTGEDICGLAKADVDRLLISAEGAVREVLLIRQQLGKTSVKKYTSMLDGLLNGRVQGLFQFYGANRTGRWAGRRVQLQNLPRNHMKDLEAARAIVKAGDYELLNMLYSEIPDVLSQLVRTALIPAEGHKLYVSDFSAIEARVLAWLAGEEWKLEVFRTHGKIYEAAAARMFGVPIESIRKSSDYRQRGKVAELALGYQGAEGALVNMGADKMGLTMGEMKTIVEKWRQANPKISQFWRDVQDVSIMAVSTGKSYVHTSSGIRFTGSPGLMKIGLPSGRELVYWGARLDKNRFGRTALRYYGIDDKKRFASIDTYGGKLVENIVQAVSRDLLVYALVRVASEVSEAQIVLHVHDEIACESQHEVLNKIERIMSEPPEWAKGLPLGAEGFSAEFYQK